MSWKRIIQNTLFAVACVIIAAGVLGCIDGIMPGLLAKEKNLERDIAVKRVELAQLEAKAAAARTDAAADPTLAKIKAQAAAEDEVNAANLEIVTKGIKLEQMKDENAKAKKIADETESGAIALAQQYGGPVIGGIALSLIPYFRLLRKNWALAKERETRDKVMANVVAAVQPLVNEQSDETKREIKGRQSNAANNLVTELQDRTIFTPPAS